MEKGATRATATFGGEGTNLQEYWEEYRKMIDETKILDEYLEEECSPRSYNGIPISFNFIIFSV